MPLTTNMDTLGVKDHTHEYTVDASTAETGTPGAIAPDDTASAGVATSLARSDHRHAITAGSASALTKSAGSSEGSAGFFARSDHRHATNVLPWGVMSPRFSSNAAQTLTSVASGGGTATTDMSLSSMAVLSTRLYTFNFVAGVSLATSSSTVGGAIEVLVDGTQVDTLWDDDDMQAGVMVWASSRKLWEPSSGTVNITTRLRNNSGTTQDFTIHARSTAGQILLRQFWVEDIGPR